MINSIHYEGGGEKSGKFDPRKLIYDKAGIPVLSAIEIEAIATEVLEKHCPVVLRAPRMTPVVMILDKLKERTGLASEFADLGYKGSSKVIGRISFPRKRCYLDESLLGSREAAFRFTVAHEIGHWILHRYNYKNWKFNNEDVSGADLEHDERGVYLLNRRTPKGWLEFQAKLFAASLVTPRQTFIQAVSEGFLKIGITSYDWGSANSAQGRYFLGKLILRLSHQFEVSKSCVGIRLKTLGYFGSDSSDN